MSEAKDKLHSWRPGTAGFSHDEEILAVGFQCRDAQFPIKDVLQWLGPPDKSWGDSVAGHWAYFYTDPDAEVFAMFDVADGRIVGFGAVSRVTDNSKRTNPAPGEQLYFNCLDEMEPFNEKAFT